MASARIHRIIACFACVHHSAAITSSVVDYHHSDIPNCINVAVIASRDCYRPRLRQRVLLPTYALIGMPWTIAILAMRIL